MRTTIDRAGRLVIPKRMRDELGVGDGGELEIELVDDVITLSPPTVPKRLEERGGRAVIVPDGDIPALTDDVVRDTIDDLRR